MFTSTFMDSTPAGPHHTLPVELEREIFERAAFLYPECMPQLLLVAQRAKTWIQPVMYQVLSIHPHGQRTSLFRLPLRTLARLVTVSPKCLRDYTRHVCFVEMPHVDFVTDLLSRCEATVNIAFVNPTPGSHVHLLPIFSTLPLQRLSANLRQLFTSEKAADFAHPLFSRITHLDILDFWQSDDWWDWAGLAQTPQLTHLSSHSRMPDSTIHGVLKHCRLLEVLVILYPSHSGLEIDVLSRGSISEDPRFVRLVVTDRLEDWETGARGGEDYWVAAKALVEKARSEKLKVY
ncbi:hypothetical protein B0H19DRAFT_1149558 [Mycena capillaripes]|nr:hypothetical protein B0H19DRAFT_1149558 [Mycena capillaripes]